MKFSLDRFEYFREKKKTLQMPRKWKEREREREREEKRNIIEAKILQ